MSGVMLVVLGLWGGLVPLIGPYFGYAFGSPATWDLTLNRFWLDVLPGAAVVLGGLLLIWSGHRVSGTVASWLALAGGAWFAVGPAVSRLWEHGPGPIGVPLFGHTRQTFELIGYFYGLGAVVIGLAAFALGRFVTRPAMLEVHEPAQLIGEDEPMTAGGEPVVDVRTHPEPLASRRPITGGDSDQEPATESEREPVHH